jgi:hypothetical protein
MQHKANAQRRSRRTTGSAPRLELSTDRAFVLHLDVRAQPPRRLLGRIEHVTSGQVAHVSSLRELLAFIAKVLRDQTRGAHGSIDADAACSPSRPTRRRRERGAGS